MPFLSPEQNAQFQEWKTRVRHFTDPHVRIFAIVTAAIAVPVALLLLLPALLGVFAPAPDKGSDLYAVNRPAAFTFLDADGNQVGHRGAVVGARLTLDEMPAYLPAAFIVMEDRRFYSHNGIDPRGLARAMFLDLRAGHLVAGGSTISQQTAKIVYSGQERTFSRKLSELVHAAGLEKALTKKQILELYLNRIYLGSGAYGVDGAAQIYFGASANKVTLAQAAMLATLTRAPSVFSPRRDLLRAQQRASLVLDALEETGAVTHAQADEARAHPALVMDQTSTDARNYFLDVAADLAKKLAGNGNHADLVVRTTLEPKLQEGARAAAARAIEKSGKRSRVSEAAVVMMKPDGAVSALLGGVNYQNSVFNRAVQAHRQPGSAFKSFVYLAAMESGITPWDQREDEAVNINGYEPQNFGAHDYGTLTLADALAHSVNTIAVNLAAEVGMPRVIEAARRLGITSPLENNPSLALGTNEVTPLELTGAYAAFANGGFRVEPYFVTQVSTPDINGKPGQVLYRRAAPKPRRVINPDVNRDMLAMLWNVVVAGTGGAASLTPRESAGKTGTTQDYKDAWYMGFTTDYVTGVWVGNDDSKPTRGITGGALPTTIWRDAMHVAEMGHKLTPLDRSPPQVMMDQNVNYNMNYFQPAPSHGDDESGLPLVRGEPAETPPAPRARRSGLLGWLFGRDEDEAPPPPPLPPRPERN